MKKIFLKNFKIMASIGIHDFEKKAPQPYNININLILNNNYLVFNDDIRETVNYDILRDKIKLLIKDGHFNLQETLMQKIIKICFSIDEKIEEVEVQIGKTEVYDDCDEVGLHYHVKRSDLNF